MRLHADGDAATAADAYQARAFTHGRHIYFAHGEYDPDSAAGRRLLYHEVAHTAQQGDAAPAVQGKLRVSQPDDASEREADRVADALVAGEPVPRVTTRGGGTVLREAAREEQPEPAGHAGDAGVSGLPSDDQWSHLIGEASTPVGKFARVKVPRGLRLRTEPHAKAETTAIMPLDTLVHVERKTSHGWAYVIALGDARDADAVTGQGFCECDFLMVDPPEPGAHLHYVQGEMPKDIAARYYKDGGFDWGADARLFVEAIWEANRDRTGGVYRRQDVELSLAETIFRGADAEDTLRVWKSIGVRDGHAIWIPSREFVAQLKAQGAISSGSISHEAWQAAKGAVGELIDWAKYSAGFVVGLVKGALGAALDLVMGVVDLAEMLYDVAKAIFREGFVGACESFGEKVAKFFEDAPQLLASLGKWFADQWTAEDAWDRGLFQGEVIGYAAMTIVIIILTMGAGAAAQAGGKFGQFVKVVRALDAAGDLTTYARGLKRVVRVPDKVTDALRGGRKIPGDAGPGGAGKPDVPDGGPGPGATRADADGSGSPSPGAVGQTVAERSVRLAGGLHKVKVQDIGGELQIWLCSDCGRMLRKVEKVLERTSDKGPDKSLHKRLSKLRDKIADAETRLKSSELPREHLHRELNQIGAHLRDLSRKHPEFDELCFFENFKAKKLDPKKAGGDLPTSIRLMMRSQKIAPDLLDKGVHFNVGHFELKVTAESGTFVLQPVFSSQKGPALERAIREGTDALKNPQFRDWIKKHAEAGLQMAMEQGKADKQEYFERVLEILSRGKE